MNYDNNNSGVLFNNRDAKEKNERAPDYKGSINVGGVDYWLSAWIKQGRDGTKLSGQKYMSLSVKPKDEQAGYAPAPAPAAAPAPRMTQDQRDAVAIAERAKRERAQAKPATNFDDMDDDAPW